MKHPVGDQPINYDVPMSPFYMTEAQKREIENASFENRSSGSVPRFVAPHNIISYPPPSYSPNDRSQPPINSQTSVKTPNSIAEYIQRRYPSLEYPEHIEKGLRKMAWSVTTCCNQQELDNLHTQLTSDDTDWSQLAAEPLSAFERRVILSWLEIALEQE